MSHVSELIGKDIAAYLHAHQHKSLLRFITCGSVDDGKSTLIGRLLYDSKMVFEDQLAALKTDSSKVGTQGGEIDFALLVDGLAAEREQGITIDVAYRFFSTDRRKFIVADTPGHEQYTRNMVTGASTADLAVILIDGRKGILTQTRRHSFIVSLLGIRHVVLAVNKMDLVGFSEPVFQAIAGEYRAFASRIGLSDVLAIPISGLRGDNIAARSGATPWYTGPTLMEHLETVEIEDRLQHAPFRLPVQWVNRPNLDFRGFAGMIVSGSVRPGDLVQASPSGRESRVTRIVTRDGDLPLAVAGQSVTLTLADEIDVSRGDVLAGAGAPPSVADQFEATVIWMSAEALVPGRPYWIKTGTRTATATLAAPRHQVAVNTLESLPADTLALNEIGVCVVTLDRAIAFDPYAANRDTGGFILIDRLTNATVAAGLFRAGLRKTRDVRWQALEADKASRAALKGQKPAVVWFTGVPEAEAAAIAGLVEKRLLSLGRHTAMLDAKSLRRGLGRDPDLSAGGRSATLRRVAEAAGLMVDAGLIVLVPLHAPLGADREFARGLVEPGEFFEVAAGSPVGDSRPPEIRLDDAGRTAESCADRVFEALRAAGVPGLTA